MKEGQARRRPPLADGSARAAPRRRFGCSWDAPGCPGGRASHAGRDRQQAGDDAPARAAHLGVGPHSMYWRGNGAALPGRRENLYRRHAAGQDARALATNNRCADKRQSPFAVAGAGAGEAPGAAWQALLSEVARGDRDAFEAICHHIAAPVFGTVRSVVRDRCQSEEVAQEVLLEVWRPRPGSTPPGAARWRG